MKAANICPQNGPLCAAVGFSTGVESQNIVGYSTQAIAGGKLSCVALQFADVGGNSAVASIANLSTSGLTAGVYDTMETDAPCIMIYNGVGYDYYFYISDAYDAEGNVVTAWADGSGDALAAEKTLGTGFWLRIPAATCSTGSLVESGEVSSAATTTIGIAAGLTLAGNPYPTAMNMSKVTTSGLTAGVYDTMETDAPCIMIYNGVGYDYYFYISDAYDAEGNVVTAWADGSGDAVTGDIADAGKAFWARSSTAGTLTFSR